MRGNGLERLNKERAENSPQRPSKDSQPLQNGSWPGNAGMSTDTPAGLPEKNYQEFGPDYIGFSHPQRYKTGNKMGSVDSQ